MLGNKALEERVHTLEKRMGTVVKALKKSSLILNSWLIMETSNRVKK